MLKAERPCMDKASIPPGFEILLDPPAPDPRTLVVMIPRGLTSARRLFALFARALRFPSYFGWNWDAFEECLTDLDWLPKGSTVLVFHADLPFPPASRERAIYLGILDNARERLKSGSAIQFRLTISV